MKRLTLLFCILLIGKTGFSQNSIKPLKEKIDHLQSIKSELSDSLYNIDTKIDKIESQIAEIQFNKFKTDKKILSLKSKADIFAADDIMSTRIGDISAGSKVVFIEYNGGYFVKINYKGKKGFISKGHFKEVEMLEQIAQNKKKLQRAEEKLVSSMIDSIEQDKRWIKTYKANFRIKPAISSKIIKQFEKGDIVYVQDEMDKWLKVKYLFDIDEIDKIDNKEDLDKVYKTGWVHSSLISEDHVEPLSFLEKLERESEIKTNNRQQKFVKKHPNIREQLKRDILEGNIRIGMTKAMVRAARGAPNDINRTVTARSTNEQWVYGSISNRVYVYFENGIMTSFQD